MTRAAWPVALLVFFCSSLCFAGTPAGGDVAIAQATSAPDAPHDANAFLEIAAHESGAVVLKRGIVYRTVTPGEGRTPHGNEYVRVEYTGRFVDGTVFDTTAEHGAFSGYLKSLIPCWTIGVAKMHVGEKAVLTCPSATAYGDKGAPPKIPGGAILQFDIELLGVQPSNR